MLDYQCFSRYQYETMNLSHLIYAEAQEKFTNNEQKDREVWEDIERQRLITYQEAKVLKKIRRKPEAVWGWILSYLQAAMEAE